VFGSYKKHTLASKLFRGLEELFSGCAVVSVFCLWQERVFGFTFVLRVQYIMAHRNRYFEWTEDRQMTPCGNPNFNSHVKYLRILVFQTDGWMDRWRHQSGGGFCNLSAPPG
jgi:hypothetical protein